MWKDKAKVVIDYIVKHSKLVFPVIVIAVVAGTVSISLNAKGEEKAESVVGRIGQQESSAESSMESSVVQESESVVPETEEDVSMVLNENPAIETLIATFYNAMAMGDADTLNSVCDEISIQDMLCYQERAKYIETYPVLEVYTKPGPEDGSVIAFIYYKVVFSGHEEQFPGYTAHYVCANEQGELYIRRGEISDEANQYIGDVMAQDDVVEFHNRVTVEYNELVSAKPELLEYLSEMDKQVSAAVGVTLAQQNAEAAQVTEGTTPDGEAQDPEGDAPEGAAESAEQPQEEAPAQNTVQYAKATTTVNVRSSDSQQADKLGKVSNGTRLKVLEQKVNGWSKVMYEGKEGYIKSEYLALIESADGLEGIGLVTATTNLNVRSSASETAEKLGVLIGGDSADLLASENGWCKIKYNGQVGYVKADYVDFN